MPKLLSWRLLVFTVIVIISNYIAFYLDDILLYYGWAETGLLVYALRAWAYPVSWYVAVVEPYTLLSIPVLGRTLNYCVELIYFYGIVYLTAGLLQCIDQSIAKPIQHYFEHAKSR